MTQTQKYVPHYRMYIEDVYRDYADGLLSVTGAVFAAIAATCPFGTAVNFNVGEFLERTGIHPRSYTRAVATLIEKNRLDFPPNAVQTLRVPTLKGTRQPVYYSSSTNSGQICDREGQNCPERSQICPDRSQICDRTEQICPEDRPESPLGAESESPSITLSTLSFSLSSGEREEDAVPEYEEWLIKKASQLPTPPTFLEEWLEKNRNKKSNRKQFLKYRQALKETSVPQPAAPAIFEVQSETEQRLETLRFWWDDGAQERVKATIAANPSWGLRAGEFGPEVVEAEL